MTKKEFLWQFKGVLLALTITAIAMTPLWLYPILNSTETAGICIYKGPTFYGTGIFGGTSSSGVPLRGIDVLAWESNAFGQSITIAEGPTDRTGCFYFHTAYGWQGFVSYTYNGTRYTDNIQAGLVLGDNLP